MGFQNRVNSDPAPAVEGDFADANIRASVVAGAGMLIAAEGVAPIVGHFAWGNQVTGRASSRYIGELVAKIGFVHRENNAIIQNFLGESVLAIAPGLIVTLLNKGSFWALLTAGAEVGQKAFARYLDGSVYADDAGASTDTATGMTGSLAGTGVLTVGALTGSLGIGDVLSGGAMPTGVAITAQISGTAGGVGTYQTTGSTVVASLAGVVANDAVETEFSLDSPSLIDAAVTASLAATGILTVTAVASGVLDIGQNIGGVGVPTGSKIIGFISGTGGAGTYRTNISRALVLTSRAMVASNGHLAKISTWG